MGGEGASPSQHIGGSISATEITEKLAKKLNHQPTPMKVFTFIHIKDHDGITFIDRHAELVRRVGPNQLSRTHVSRRFRIYEFSFRCTADGYVCLRPTHCTAISLYTDMSL
ncbi:hypothetical protein JCGZ_14811 [Jatropha curcas]|uniref:Uncharacterized protein n=1 Tax=Jatropha curcas TaxID=180498 RepID=A0A067K5T2_JATCU|nr:hypothetical protein JCGZ_14811 [Jatropha curcas]